MRRYLHAAILCIAIAAFVAFWGIVFYGCASRGKLPETSWKPAYEPAWADVTLCYRMLGHDTDGIPRPPVQIHTGCQIVNGAGAWEKQPGFWVHGSYEWGVVEVCEDLKALHHELSHHVSKHVRGNIGWNGEGICYL